MIGYMPMPADFPYRELFLAGRPQHKKFDDFWLRHPNMDYGRRAKIFSPFDALKGFSEAVSAKEVQYEWKRDLSQQRKNRIEETLQRINRLTINGRVARENKIAATVEYYVPCADLNHAAYGLKGLTVGATYYLPTTGNNVYTDSFVTVLAHVVRPGETALSIFSGYGIDYYRYAGILWAFNAGVDLTDLRVGQNVMIPVV